MFQLAFQVLFPMICFSSYTNASCLGLLGELSIPQHPYFHDSDRIQYAGSLRSDLFFAVLDDDEMFPLEMP